MKAYQQFKQTQFDILRHGECEGGNIFRGSTDVALTAEGFNNMQTSCDKLNEQWDVIIASPLIRCHHFAQQLAAHKNIPLITEPRIAEINFGDWEGQLRDTIWQNTPEQLTHWIENPVKHTPPNGEPLAEVQTRLAAFFEDAYTQYQHKKILLVAHGGVIRVLLTTLLDMPLARAQTFDVPFASLSRVKVLDHGDKRITKLIAHNFIGQKV